MLILSYRAFVKKDRGRIAFFERDGIIMIKGPYGVLMTPFDEDGKVDFASYEKELDFLAKSQIGGFFVCGTTGEFISTSIEENKKMIKFAMDFFKGKKKLLAGASSPNYQTTVDYMKYAYSLGYETAVICPPYYFTMGAEDVYRYYARLADEDICDILLYRIPMFTNTIEIPVFERLLDKKRIVAMKDSSANMKQIAHEADIISRTRPDFSLMSGTDDCLVPALVCGCKGSMTAFSVILPELNSKIYSLMAEGKIAEANKVNQSYLKLLRLADSAMFPSGYKYIFSRRGFKMGTCQAEDREKLESMKSDIDEELKELGVI